MNTNKIVDLLSPAEMAKQAEEAALYKVTKSPFATLFSAITAGVFISIAFAFYITVTIGTSTIPYGIAKLIGGICFSLGLMLVVACGADLFTSTILTIIPRKTKRTSWSKMLLNWGLVYVGNFIGALIFIVLIWFSGQHMAADTQWGTSVLSVANYKLHHTFTEAVFLGILANLMVCLAVWMNYAGRSLIDKMFVMILPVAMFVASGFEHSIANMFMIPMGIIINNFASAEFWTNAGIMAETYQQLTVGNFITNNLIPVTIGNIIGGLMVGLTYWYMYLRKKNQ